MRNCLVPIRECSPAQKCMFADTAAGSLVIGSSRAHGRQSALMSAARGMSASPRERPKYCAVGKCRDGPRGDVALNRGRGRLGGKAASPRGQGLSGGRGALSLKLHNKNARQAKVGGYYSKRPSRQPAFSLEILFPLQGAVTLSLCGNLTASSHPASLLPRVRRFV